MGKERQISVDECAREVAAEWVLLDELHPWAENPRKNASAIKDVARSIKRFGFGAPILARTQDREIIAGHTRYLAAKQLGLKKVPVRFLELDPAESHLLAMADNRLGEIAEWDDAALQRLLSGYSLEDVDLAGWSKDDLDKMAGDLGDEDTGSGAPALGGLIYRVIVECTGEQHQTELIERFEVEGLKCQPLIS